MYLPDELRNRVRLTAQARGVSDATVIREAIEAAVGHARRSPRGGLFAGKEPIADRVDELLAGFGDR